MWISYSFAIVYVFESTVRCQMESSKIKFITCENLIILYVCNVYTVFCRIHAPARTPKSPEGRLHSGLIISKSERCPAASGIPELAVSFLMAGKSRVHAYSTH